METRKDIPGKKNCSKEVRSLVLMQDWSYPHEWRKAKCNYGGTHELCIKEIMMSKRYMAHI